jgi:hypothetical protein
MKKIRSILYIMFGIGFWLFLGIISYICGPKYEYSWISVIYYFVLGMCFNREMRILRKRHEEN